jgi:hypothetical protein
MNENSDKSGTALRQVALMNLILTLYNVMALTPVAHRQYGRQVNSLQTALREASRQLVPLSWYSFDRRVHELYQYGATLALEDPDSVTWRALLRWNPVPNRIMAKVNKAVNHCLIEYSVAFRDLDHSYEHWYRRAFWPFARFRALQVLLEAGEHKSASALRALELVGTVYDPFTCNYSGLLPRGEE